MRRSYTLIALIAVAVLLNACASGTNSSEPTAAPQGAGTAAPSGATSAAPPGATPAPAQSTQQPVAAPAGNVRTFHIVSGQSEAFYKAQEKFLERPLPSKAIGKTNNVQGTFQFSTDGKPSGKILTATVDLRTLQSDAPPRDDQVRMMLDTRKYPFAEFTSTDVQGAPDSYSEGQEVALKVTGDLKIHGITKPATFDVRGTLQGDTVMGSATTTVSLKDYGIDAGSFFGITIDDSMILALNFIAKDATSSQVASGPTSQPLPTAEPTSAPTSAPVAPAVPLKDTNRIAFISQRDGNDEIYVMNADGSGQTRLSNDPAFDSAPTWSPDGKKIAFVSSQSMFEGKSDIYVVNADGSELTNLTKDAPGGGQSPTWSPDSSKIAFAAGGDGPSVLTVMNPDGSGKTRLTKNSVEDRSPVWSPDGTKIAYVAGEENPHVYVINADGSGETQLTKNPLPIQGLVWSPDSKKIAYVTGEENTEIYVVNADGSSDTQLTKNPSFDGFPAWSPDGSRIAFRTFRDSNFDIFVMNADGSEQTNLTKNPADDETPAWSPDGKQIAFASNRGGHFDIYVMNADGSNPTPVSNDPVGAGGPVWQQQ
jgi:Tol biopolymer transport system component/polyisoprenoid-binding protein YceI